MKMKESIWRFNSVFWIVENSRLRLRLEQQWFKNETFSLVVYKFKLDSLHDNWLVCFDCFVCVYFQFSFHACIELIRATWWNFYSVWNLNNRICFSPHNKFVLINSFWIWIASLLFFNKNVEFLIKNITIFIAK